MAARNLGLGSRDISKVGKFALGNGDLSFSSVATVVDRWKPFANYMVEKNIKDLKYLCREDVVAYGLRLSERVDSDEISVSYAQNLVSAVNTVLLMATFGEWRAVSPTKDCLIPNRSHIRTSPPDGLCRDEFYRALGKLGNELAEGKAVAVLAREFGLRTKEAALLDIRRALEEANRSGYVNITRGTKGGRKRKVPISLSTQTQALEFCLTILGSRKVLIPVDINWEKFRGNQIRQTREALQQYGISRLHELRAAYACERYEQLSGEPAPVLCGKDTPLGHMARIKIALELGHGRIDVTSSYLGGRNADAGAQS
ncbi:integrase [Pseudomonas sp. SCT]|uniref:integrase domain-containing protein n=1 Tax=Pseudomonas sp. (strain SCT) TaxID=412955 RepID=UPI000EC6883E|nr:integrase domain-containing protein [Pseudomonas sp. SCT]GCA58305.1 integrase [Pseudomonas sp. SCT]